MPISLRFDSLRQAYRQSSVSPVDVMESVLANLDMRGADFVWTALADRGQILQRAQQLTAQIHDIDRFPLFGLPFGVKDNIDVAGIPTTCGCPGFSHIPTETAFAVQQALDAGAIFVGKQSLDQFATGLNGTRTLGGHCKNVFDPQIIPGGSSSGSAVAVAAGLVSFSLGTDTGGSGRVPAALNNIVGWRPSMGLVSSRGMVYNNRLFDCMPVFAPTVQDAWTVLQSIATTDPMDPLHRVLVDRGLGPMEVPQRFRFAVPDQLEFFGDAQTGACFEQAIDRLREMGGSPCEIDFSPFQEAGQLVFESALVAERGASYGWVLDQCPQDLVTPVATVLQRARQYTAEDAFRAQYRLAELRCLVARQLQGIDVLVTPTVARPFRVQEMLAEPMVRNAQMGHYTYGIGPLDLCALALPAALRPDGLPFGISLVARAGEDGVLRALGERFERATGLPPGAEALQ